MNAARSGEVGGGISARVVALLTLAAFINYVDRGNLATAGPLIRDQFDLSNTQLGLLLSAFFWSYTPAQLPAGWLAERLDARRVLAVGLAVWGAATALTGLATGFAMLLVLRVMLGLGESVMYPASFKILAQEAHEGQRGRANGFLAAGLKRRKRSSRRGRRVCSAGQRLERWQADCSWPGSVGGSFSSYSVAYRFCGCGHG